MRKIKVSAFTLLECLIALMILSGSLLVLEGLTKVLTQEAYYQTSNQEKDWQIFSQQLRAEWQSCRLIRVENNKIYLDKKGQTLAFGKSKSDDFRKTNDKGQGYQPMLYGVKNATFRQEGQLVWLELIFENGEERTYVYAFEEKS
ncbi:TPA: prepilin-type N-terminal cleavage/methylation domain-containing protein [Streptococcus suis]|nr:prepilin-type N-terminal cleavage/methylation domain-containing protein [Streptococcus suis]